MRRKKLKIKNIFILISIILVMVIVFLLLNLEKTSQYNLNIKNIMDNTKKESVSLNKVRIYGTHLNISGILENKKVFLDNINEAKLIFKNIDNKKDITIDIEYDVNSKGNLIFYTSDKINQGINLEKLNIGDYIMLLKMVEKNYNTNKDDVNYYKIINNDTQKRFDYYTITKNGKNNKITINNYTNEIEKNTYKYTKIDIRDTKLPDNVYDIVIDPGHGGKDGGATVNGYNEKDITLDYGLLLKEKLESIGLKVKLTRDGTNEDDLGIYDMYGDNGRAVIPNDVKAKFAFSIHLNSAEYKINTGGIEIYVPGNADITLAKNMAENIVESASTTFSPSMTYKIEKGIYLRTFTYEEINASKKQAEEDGYEPYDLTTDTTYYFYIRETGGLNTGAYVDGRNTDYGKNKYYNSAIGVESYLVELGFMVSNKDLNNLINNKEGYANGMTKTIEDYLNTLK